MTPATPSSAPPSLGTPCPQVSPVPVLKRWVSPAKCVCREGAVSSGSEWFQTTVCAGLFATPALVLAWVHPPHASTPRAPWYPPDATGLGVCACLGTPDDFSGSSTCDTGGGQFGGRKAGPTPWLKSPCDLGLEPCPGRPKEGQTCRSPWQVGRGGVPPEVRAGSVPRAGGIPRSSCQRRASLRGGQVPTAPL